MFTHRLQSLPQLPLALLVPGILIGSCGAAKAPGSAPPDDPAAPLMLFTIIILIVLGPVSCRLVAKRHGVPKRTWWGMLGSLLPIAFFTLGLSFSQRPGYDPLYAPTPFIPENIGMAFLLGLIGCGIAAFYTYFKTKPMTVMGSTAPGGTFCGSCGAQMSAGQKFCPSCGAAQA